MGRKREREQRADKGIKGGEGNKEANEPPHDSLSGGICDWDFLGVTISESLFLPPCSIWRVSSD